MRPRRQPPPGVPNGPATTATIGPAGGALTSDDGLFAIDIPAGALESDTEITIQPITNTAWGGVGDGYRLTPDGLTFVEPVDLVFDVAPEDLAGGHPAFLQVAYQDGEGFWYALNSSAYDEAEGTLAAQTTHFTDFSQIGGTQIRPASASVATSGVIDLNVRLCQQEQFDELTSLLYSCDEELVPLGTFSNWSVNGVAGGNSAVGTVVAIGSNSARYTAPSSVPQSNPVAVSVRARTPRTTQTLVCNITIGGTWYGTATADFGDGERIVATLVWRSAGTFQHIETFSATGTVEYMPNTDFGESCSFVSFEPGAIEIVESDGHLIIDHSSDPAIFYGTGLTMLPSTLCFTCEGWKEPECQEDLYALTWMNAEQSDHWELTNGGNTISHVWGDLTGEGVIYTVNFTRGVPPPRPKP